MAAVAVAGRTPQHGIDGVMKGERTTGPGRDLGVHSYYQGKIDELELVVRDRTQNLERLKAQRNELNAKVRLLREELHHLQESGSFVGEVVKAMGKKKVRGLMVLPPVFVSCEGIAWQGRWRYLLFDCFAVPQISHLGPCWITRGFCTVCVRGYSVLCCTGI